jgi:outer membrane receptor for ferrienterochelin and colicins
MTVAARRLALALALAAFASPAIAQDEEETTEAEPPIDPADERVDEAPLDEEAIDLEGLSSLLDEQVVTTASRGAERASSAPAAIFTITAADIRTFGIRTVDEALAYLGIGIQTPRVRDYLGGGDIGAQGLLLRDVGRHVLVLLDGQVMNAQDTGAVVVHEGLGVPLEAIDHIEVVLGAGSVMYGSNAMLAVVHIFTRRAGDDPGIHATAELGVMPPMGEDGQPTTPTAPADRVGLRYRFGLGFARSFRVLGSDAELTIRTEWLEEIGNSFRIPQLPGALLQVDPGATTWGGTAQQSLTAPSLVAALRVGDFRLAIQASHFQRSMPLNGTFNDPRAIEERTSLRIDLRHSALLDAHVALTTRLYAGLQDWSETSFWTSPYWCVPGQIDGCSYAGRSRGRWAGIEQQIAIDWNLDGALVTTVGYDVRARDATSRSADYYDRLTGAPPPTTRIPYAHTVSVLGAVFAQQVWQPIEWLAINGGARVDIDSLFGARVSPRLAATFLPVDGTSIRVSYAEAFRAPTAYELNEVDPTYRARAPGLQPEIARTGELEWQQRVAWLSFSLRGFVSFYEGFIDNRSVTDAEFAAGRANGDLASTAEAANVIRWDNLGTLRTIGGSLSFTLRPVEGLMLGGSLTITDTRRDEQLIPLVPLWMGNARIAYTFAPDGATLAFATTFVGRRIAYADFDTLSMHEASEQVDMRATFTSPLPGVPGLRLRVAFSYSLNPFMPYLLEAPNPDEPTAPVALAPVTSSLFGFMGLQYDLDP